MTLTPFNWQTPNKYNALQAYDYNTPAGKLILLTQGEVLCNIEWLIASTSRLEPEPLPEELQTQLNHYWLSSTTEITLPLMRQGTDFQHRVWNALRQIPLRQTRTYGELAKDLNTSPRALANACRKNPFPLIIPCHRVVAKSGIGGYAGAVTGRLIDIKTTLLQHEKMLADEL